MPKLVPIVEGPGEVKAVPLLLRRLLHEVYVRFDIHLATPKNAHGLSNLTPPGALERFVHLASLETDCGAILVLVDADKNCPVTLAKEFRLRIAALNPKVPVTICVANSEYEAWFLASLATISGHSLKGRAGIPDGVSYERDPEAIVGVKGWLTGKMPSGRSYKETEDQEAMTALIDFTLAAQCRSFRRLQHAVEEALVAIDTGTVIVTPQF